MTGRALLACGGILGALLAGAPDASGQAAVPPQQHESVVVNIEVPVRVLRKDVFVDELTLADFEVYENGVRQPLEAVYVIKDRKVLREEKLPGASPPAPRKGRHYLLYLDLKEYVPRIGDALDYFFTDVIGPEDTLHIVTPAKTYRFKSEALSGFTRLQISERLKGKLRTDIALGNSRYRALMVDFYKLEEEEFPPELADVKETMLFEQAREIRDLTEITEDRIMGFAEVLKSLDGEKHVFLIFQREVLPDHEFSEERQAELVKPAGFDTEKIKRHFADASITVHSLYITKRPGFANRSLFQGGSVIEARLQDLSSDVYASFKQMASATGGLSESTTNPNAALRQAADASSNYYLLYYRPLAYRADGRFQEIEVRVKGEGLKVTHRLGYVAD